MKPLTLLLFITGSTIVLAQNQKKQQRLLKAELAAEQQKQEDAIAVFRKTRAEFDSVKLLGNDKIGFLKNDEKKVLDRFFTYSGLQYMLKELEVAPPQLIGSFKSEEVPVQQVFVEPIRSTLNTTYVFERVSDKVDLGNLSRKEQNKVLKRKLEEYKRYAASNTIHLGEMKDSRDRISAFLPRLDSLRNVYEVLANDMTSDSWKMQDKLTQLETEFRKKGPKGYTEAYFRVFPEAFPGFLPTIVDEVRVKIAPVQDLMPEQLPQVIVERNEQGVFEWTEENPAFVGGKEAMDQFIRKNLRYPESVEQGIVFGKVFVKFIVSENGEISAVQVLKGIPACPECGEEAIRLVKSMPNWTPGKQEGKVVKSYVGLPVKFEL